MSDLSALLAEMRDAADDAAALGEFRNADGTPNYPAIARYMQSAIVIHTGDDVVGKDGSVTRAGIAVFPLSFCVLASMGFTTDEIEHAYESTYPGDDRVARAQARQEEFEQRFPEARRAYGNVEPERPKPREQSDALGLDPVPPNLVQRIFRRRTLRR